jgi:hypothetical protein
MADEIDKVSGMPNGALRTSKVLVYTGLIYPWSRLTNYL